MGKLAKKYKGKNTTTAGKKTLKRRWEKGKNYLTRVRKLLSKQGESICNCFVPGNHTKRKNKGNVAKVAKSEEKRKTKHIF